MLSKHKSIEFSAGTACSSLCLGKSLGRFLGEARPAVARSYTCSLPLSLIADDWKKVGLKEASPLSYYQDLLGFS